MPKDTAASCRSRLLFSMAETAQDLDMSIKTLRAHCVAGTDFLGPIEEVSA